MNNEIALVLDILEELKQECKSISKAQAELRTTLAEQPTNSIAPRTTTQETVQIHLSKETQAKIKEHQLFVLEALSQSSKKLDPKFEALQQLISKQQKPVEFKYYSLFASIQLAERILLLLVCGLVMVSCWFFAMGANQLQTSSDYDLRYRYLRMQGKATSKDFAYLDSLFVTHRNPKVIQQVQRKVVDYEQALQQQTELLLEQKRIQQEQGELNKHLKK
ncbi:hypothetical protein PI172_2494 [Prevotella intermedia]|uniref:Uncharacterized protein n=1 Tax=Prevotella intermedia TaxID=28131 RepID=A0A0H5B3F3_PREIN|nr:hypothetical protein [Prevotella intermedia]AFJ07581.1 hypothetical protein PIN17_0421 [Prevotella intermedia 17]APW35162.1 hypothetical protein BWX40_09550 [Prevotella intermedia]APW35599.1 hypothetical protein BWX40_12150 [Prevotella intermedia]BAR96671.1 hypothetical protein PI172_1943 [Prevotella intermedia]BAR97222.1 hypothetical protein PI172_2494 [Prevotella intermedia]